MSKWSQKEIDLLLDLAEDHTYKATAKKINKKFKTKHTTNAVRKAYERYKFPVLEMERKLPKILLFDIETLPVEAYVWGLWDQNVGLNMIKEDWSVLSYAAKWYGEDEIYYKDVKGQRDVRDDKKVCQSLWKLLDEADYVVGHNSDAFDVKKMNARFALNGLKPPSSYRRLDTLKMAKKHFKFTSNKLEYLTDKLCVKYKKLKHNKFPGFSMWSECMKKNPEAFAAMEEYNKYDVLSLEELFNIMLPWENANLFHLYSDSNEPTCTCGSQDFKKNGFYYTNASKFQKYRCKSCGAEYRDTKNLIGKDKKKMGNTRR